MKNELTTCRTEQENRNQATIPTKEELDAFFDEYQGLLARVEMAALEENEKEKELTRGLIWAACEKLDAGYEIDSLIETATFSMNEVLRLIRSAQDHLTKQRKFIRALYAVEKRGRSNEER